MSSDRQTITVIVPAYNAVACLPACLEGVQRQTRIPDEIIVVDDGSTDQTADIARQHEVIVCSEPNQGPASARNMGVRQATGDIVLFTDADCIPTPHWVEELAKPFHDNGIVGAQGAYTTKQTSLVARFVQQEFENKYERTARRASIDLVATYSAAYRRDVFLQNKGFDPVFRVPSVEDQEFSFRLARKGYRMVFVPAATVSHLHDKDLMEYIKRKFGLGYYKAFMLRWLPQKALGDSHTPPSQQIQIPILFMVGVFCVMALVWPVCAVLALISLITFYVTAWSLLWQIWRKDRAILPAAIFLLLCRAAILGIGLLAGFVHPPKQMPRQSLSI